MNISDMVKSYLEDIKSKASLNKEIKLSNGKVLKKGTVSQILIKKDNGNYHFEVNDNACEVTKEEITFIKGKK